MNTNVQLVKEWWDPIQRFIEFGKSMEDIVRERKNELKGTIIGSHYCTTKRCLLILNVGVVITNEDQDHMTDYIRLNSTFNFSNIGKMSLKKDI